jgi:hypothetical protein
MAPQLVTLPSGKSFPGFALPFAAEQPGLYTVLVTAKTKDQTSTSEPFTFFVKPYSPETVPRPARVEILQALSKVSGGHFYENVTELNQGLAGLKLQAIEEKSAEYHTLWREWPIVVGLMAMLTTSWSMRKFRDMP